MGAIVTAANSAFRDYNTDGVPASGAHPPVKSDIRSLFSTVESMVTSGGTTVPYTFGVPLSVTGVVRVAYSGASSEATWTMTSNGAEFSGVPYRFGIAGSETGTVQIAYSGGTVSTFTMTGTDGIRISGAPTTFGIPGSETGQIRLSYSGGTVATVTMTGTDGVRISGAPTTLGIPSSESGQLRFGYSGGSTVETIAMTSSGLRMSGAPVQFGIPSSESGQLSFADSASATVPTLGMATLGLRVQGAPFYVNNNTVAPPVTGFTPNFNFGVIGADGQRSILACQSFGNTIGGEVSWLSFSSRGTAAVPTQIKSGDFQSEYFTHGYTNAGSYNFGGGAGFIVKALEDYTATAVGASILTYVTKATTATAQLASEMKADTFELFTSAPASGSNRFVTINGANAGTSGGSSLIGNNGGATAWAIGNSSSIIGGAYDVTLQLYSPTAAYRFNGLTAGLATLSSNGTVSSTAVGTGVLTAAGINLGSSGAFTTQSAAATFTVLSASTSFSVTGGNQTINNQDGTSAISISNNSAGVSATAMHQASNGTNLIQFGMRGTGQNAYGCLAANTAFIYGATDFEIVSDGGKIVFGGASGVEKARLTTTGGFAIGTTQDPGAGGLSVKGVLYTLKGTVAVINGLNSDIATPASSYVRLTGPTGVFSIGGFTGGADGRELTIYDTVAFAMTIVNEDASSTAGNRIKTLTGANVTLRAGTSCASFIYDSTDSRWVLISSN